MYVYRQIKNSVNILVWGHRQFRSSVRYDDPRSNTKVNGSAPHRSLFIFSPCVGSDRTCRRRYALFSGSGPRLREEKISTHACKAEAMRRHVMRLVKALCGSCSAQLAMQRGHHGRTSHSINRH